VQQAGKVTLHFPVCCS